MTYKIIGSPKTRAFRVMWMLEELGEPYELDPKPPRDPSVQPFNPSGKVPILLDGSDAIIDSVAICQYLADKHGRFTFPAGTVKRAQQDSFTQLAIDDFECALWTAAKHKFVLPKELRVEGVQAACQHDIERAYATLSARLGSNQYVMGDEFTVPDLLLGHCAGWALSMHWKAEQENVKAYISRVRSRPAFEAATKKRDAA